MRKLRTGLKLFLSSLLVAFVAGCGFEVVATPFVESIIPAQGAANVAVNTALSATFSMAMNPATISAKTFTLTGPSGTVAGSVTYSGTTATFTPVANLAYSAVYTATITGCDDGVKNLGGTPMIANYALTFTTITPPPTMAAVAPANGTTNVPVAQVLTATFNKSMNPGTISATTFAVTGPGGVAVPGAVAYSDLTATFMPSSNLAYSTVYTATMTTGAQSLTGTPLAAAYVWQFTTASPPPTAIAVVPANRATSVPVSQVLIATFSESMNPGTLNAATFAVTGPGGVAVPGAVAYSGLTATFTPAVKLAYGAPYTATITTGAASLAGTPLASTYVWSFTTIAPPPPVVTATAPANTAASVPVAQVLTATFNEPMNCATYPASAFIVTGPGTTAVAGTVGCTGSIATFTPSVNLAYSTVYTATITTGAKNLAGIGLATNYVWSFTTIAPPPPVVTATAPTNTATSVPVAQVLTATFNESMNCATYPASAFIVTGPGTTAVAGTVGCTGSIATFTPSVNLAYSTVYTATITNGAKNLAGIGLATNYVWSFTTIARPPPVVTATAPTNTATSVPVAQVITATFNESMSAGTLNAATFAVTGPGGVTVPGAVAYSGLTATFTPASNLAYSSSYVATISTGAKNLAGTGLASNYVWSFTTVSPALAVISTVPVDTATGVLVSQVLSATFSAPMNCLAFPATAFTVSGPGATSVPGTIGCTGTTATFTPAADLAINTVFTATITTAAKDLLGNSLASNYVWTFRTVPAPTPPTVISTVPVNGATGVPINLALTATFSEAMSPASINTATFLLTAAGGTSVTGVVTYVAAGAVATFTPATSLASNTVYTATITTGAQDLASTALAQNFVWTFTTATAPIITPPTVTATIPADLATAVPLNQIVSATFSMAMNPATIGSTSFTLTGPGATAVSGLVAYAAIGNTLTFTPTTNLVGSTLFTATITTGAQNLAGIALVNNYVWTFTTDAAPDILPPQVISTVPTNSATNVPLNQAVSATFTEAMNPLTLTTATFQLTQGGTLVPATITYDAINFIATLTPTALLASSSSYSATVTTGATDLAGNPLAGNHVWSFTTITLPTVTAMAPASGTVNVPIAQMLSATFSETMNCATLASPAATFIVTGPGASVVAGTAGCTGGIATFAPSVNLAFNTVYTATITTGAASLADTPLASTYVWSFTTIAPPPPVVTATAPANTATSVPVAQVLTATFNESMSAGTLNAATFAVRGPGGVTVPGTVSYTGTAATFIPAANLAYSTVYTATMTTGAQSLAGAGLTSNYVWTFTTVSPPPAVIATVPVNGATGVPVTQVLTATFNKTMNCATLASPATTFTVTGPGPTAVAGTVSCAGSVSTFTPDATLAVNTLYTATIHTGAWDLAGTAMASSYVWSFLTLPAPTPPTVISTVPINTATAVPVNQALTATFSVAMSAATIDPTTFTLTAAGGAAVTGVVTYVAAGSVATFTPAASLASNTVYTATITTGAQDLANTALAQNFVWTFTTATAPIITPPTVTATIPADLATAVSLNQIVSATFSMAMNPATITAISPATFTLLAQGSTTPESGLVAYAAIGNALVFTPTANLAASTLYTATLTTSAQNLAGVALASNYVWTFTTGTAPAIGSPKIVLAAPADSATNVPLNQAVSATFSEAMNPLTLTTATFYLTQGGTPIPATITYDANNFIATLTPTALLTASSSYVATVTMGATDLAGSPLGNTGISNPWTFTTGTAVLPPPVVLGSTVSLFGSFGGNAGVTNQGVYTVVNGNIGTTAASQTITGFHDTSILVGSVYECTYTETPLNIGQVNGTIDTAPGSSQPTTACPNEATSATASIATQAALEAQTAFTTLQSLPPGVTLLTNELGNRTLAPGTYTSASFYGITTGNLTLDAQGDPNAFWVFQMASSLTVGTTTSPESVLLINGAQAKNVFWVVGGAPGAVINYGGGGTMVGTIISSPGITISSPGQSTSSTLTTINGRVLALNASVTMVNTIINVPAP